MPDYFRCDPSYGCPCHLGKLVSLRTARRHRDAAVKKYAHRGVLSCPPDPSPASPYHLQSGAREVPDEQNSRHTTRTTDILGDRPPTQLPLRQDHQQEDIQPMEVYPTSQRERSGRINSRCDYPSSHGIRKSSPSQSPLRATSSATPADSVEDKPRGTPSDSDASVCPDGDSGSPKHDVYSFASSVPPRPTSSSSSSIFTHEEPNEEGVVSSVAEQNGEESSNEQCMVRFDAALLMETYGWYAGMYIRHCLTVRAMDDLLEHNIPGNTKVWATVRNRFIDASGICTTTVPYCSRYHMAFPVNEAVENMSCSHRDCLTTSTDVCHLKYIHLKERIISMIQSSTLGDDMKNYVKDGFKDQEGKGLFQDFFSGSLFSAYVSSLPDFFVSSRTSPKPEVVHVFLHLSTDGAPAFRSTAHSFWPVIAYVGNLPPSKRYKVNHVLPLLCIPGNPSNMDSFLEVLFEELDLLHGGVPFTLPNGNEAILKVHAMFILTDLMANRKIGHLVGVNGIRPCRFCMISGQRRGRTTYYPDKTVVRKRKRNGEWAERITTHWSPLQLPLRTVRDTKESFSELEGAFDSGTVQQWKDIQKKTGIKKEAPIFKRCRSLSPYESMPVDLMHLLFENIAPRLVDIWLGDIATDDSNTDLCFLRDSENRRRVDDFLDRSGIGICDLFRRPRVLKYRKQWKADEWRTFVSTTSLIAFHNRMDSTLLHGWGIFCRLCELSMRPVLSSKRVDRIETLAQRFFTHFSETYYAGKKSSVHVMNYSLHLLLHIAQSTRACGPLVCLSQFPAERYIGVVKHAARNTRVNFEQSVTARWMLEQATGMLSVLSGIPVPLQSESDHIYLRPPPLDKRSFASDKGAYTGYFLRGPRSETNLRDAQSVLNFNLRGALERFYESNKGLTRAEVQDLLTANEDVVLWDRLFFRSDDGVTLKFGRFKPPKHTRSNAYVAAEFQEGSSSLPTTTSSSFGSSVAGGVHVYFGEVLYFIEHSVTNFLGVEECYILVACNWVTRGLTSGCEGQVFKRRRLSGAFNTVTVENVTCLRRNISVFENVFVKDRRRRCWTYFVDEMMHAENLMGEEDEHIGCVQKRLQGFS